MGYNQKTLLDSPGIILTVSVVLAVLSLIFPVSSSTGYGFLLTDHLFWSHFLSFACITLVAISLYYINNSCFLVSTNSALLPALYFLLVFSNPGTVFLSRFHIVGLLMIWSVYFSVRYLTDEKKKMGMLFISVLLTSVSAVIIPYISCMLAILFFVTFFYRPQDFFRYFFTFISAVLLPLVYIFSYRYMFSEVAFVEFFQGYWATISDASIHIVRMNYLRIFYYVVMTIMFFRLTFFIFHIYSNRKEAFRRLIQYAYLFTVMVVILILMVLYYHSDTTSSTIALNLPFSILAFDFMANSGNKKESSAFLLLLIIVSASYWLSFFI